MGVRFDAYHYRNNVLQYDIAVLGADRLNWKVYVQFWGYDAICITTLHFDTPPNRRQVTKKVKEAVRAWVSRIHHDAQKIQLIGEQRYDDE